MATNQQVVNLDDGDNDAHDDDDDTDTDDNENDIDYNHFRLNDAHNSGYSKVQPRVQVVNDPLCGIRPQVMDVIM